jgi:hypothetical protein
LGLIQQARQSLKHSLANLAGVSEAVNPLTTRGRSTARAGGGGEVIIISRSHDSIVSPTGRCKRSPHVNVSAIVGAAVVTWIAQIRHV